MNEEKKETINLTPLTRLSLTFHEEIKLDDKGVFNKEVYDGYIYQQKLSEDKMNALIKGILFYDSLLFLILSGQHWSVPGVGIVINDLPVIKEILVFIASFSFLMVGIYFATNQCYSFLVDQFGNIIVNDKKIDPDFYNASKKNFLFAFKIFRAKMNNYGVDFFEANKPFHVFSVFIIVITLFAIACLPIIHFVLIYNAYEVLFSNAESLYSYWLLVTATGLMNLGGISYILGMGINFTFSLDKK